MITKMKADEKEEEEAYFSLILLYFIENLFACLRV